MTSALVYILFSEKTNEFYIGYTKMSVNERLAMHLEKTFVKAHTSMSEDWSVFYTIPCERVKQTIQIERHIKKMKSRKYLHNLKNYAAISLKLKEKYTF